MLRQRRVFDTPFSLVWTPARQIISKLWTNMTPGRSLLLSFFYSSEHWTPASDVRTLKLSNNSGEVRGVEVNTKTGNSFRSEGLIDERIEISLVKNKFKLHRYRGMDILSCLSPATRKGAWNRIHKTSLSTCRNIQLPVSTEQLTDKMRTNRAARIETFLS